ncbi:hypothetical protein OAL19_00815 [bacterium]|nr:hypothetical protein [bacterium]
MISHYLQQARKPDTPYGQYDLHTWIKKFKRQNWQVKMLAGHDNLELALKTVKTRFAMIGLNERFLESLFLFKEKMGLKFDFGPDRDPGPRPPEPKPKLEKARRQYLESKEEIDELFKNSTDLYQQISNEIFESQVNDYGGHSKLQADLKKYLASRPKTKKNFNYYSNRSYATIHPKIKKLRNFGN